MAVRGVAEVVIGRQRAPQYDTGPHMVQYLRAANVKDGVLDLDDVKLMNFTPAEQQVFALRPGDVLVTEGSGSLGAVGASAVWQGELTGAVCFQNTLLRMRPRTGVMDGRFLAWWARSAFGNGEFASIATGANIYHLSAERVRGLPVDVAALDEQRRIADFLDAETARIDRLVELRRTQRVVLEARFTQLLDSAVAADANALSELGCLAESSAWSHGKISRSCVIIPGYAFPSDGFVPNSCVRLLRGVNVGTGSIDWSESVSWDVQRSPIPSRFHLQPGDLVMGMDRPWISTGMRLAFVDQADLPALLLQRVACLRPRSDVSMRYIRWVLSSGHFRQGIEAELTGVSVPHISGDQIGNFEFLLPPPDKQQEVAAALDTQAEVAAMFGSKTDRQLSLLAERRQALITAAVTGQFDVSTTRGADLS
jgi:type I restriction enzyme S subunit